MPSMKIHSLYLNTYSKMVTDQQFIILKLRIWDHFSICGMIHNIMLLQKEPF